MEETGIIIVKNGLDTRVKMEFYSDGLPSGLKTVSKTGKGEIFRGEDTNRVVLIHEILQADSILLIFDNVRIETHYLYTLEPVGHSLFVNDSYQNQGNTGTYTITSINFNNAEPCNGPCN